MKDVDLFDCCMAVVCCQLVRMTEFEWDDPKRQRKILLH